MNIRNNGKPLTVRIRGKSHLIPSGDSVVSDQLASIVAPHPRLLVIEKTSEPVPKPEKKKSRSRSIPKSEPEPETPTEPQEEHLGDE